MFSSQLFNGFLTEKSCEFLDQYFTVHDPGRVSHRKLWEGIRTEVLEAYVEDADARYVIVGNADYSSCDVVTITHHRTMPTT